MLCNDKLFAARFLYVVDVQIQNFLRDAQQGNFNASPLDIERTFEQIVHDRTFTAHLPSCIHNSKNKKEQDDERNNNAKRVTQ